MPLHEDVPDRPGNLSDEAYVEATRELMATAGDAGLHTVPDEILNAAIERARALHATE